MSVKFSSKTVGSLFSGGTGGTFRMLDAGGQSVQTIFTDTPTRPRLRGLGQSGTWTVFYKIDGKTEEFSVRVDADTERHAIDNALELIRTQQQISTTAVSIERVIPPSSSSSGGSNAWIKPVAIGGVVLIGAWLLLGKR